MVKKIMLLFFILSPALSLAQQSKCENQCNLFPSEELKKICRQQAEVNCNSSSQFIDGYQSNYKKALKANTKPLVPTQNPSTTTTDQPRRRVPARTPVPPTVPNVHPTVNTTPDKEVPPIQQQQIKTRKDLQHIYNPFAWPSQKKQNDQQKQQQQQKSPIVY